MSLYEYLGIKFWWEVIGTGVALIAFAVYIAWDLSAGWRASRRAKRRKRKG